MGIHTLVIYFALCLSIYYAYIFKRVIFVFQLQLITIMFWGSNLSMHLCFEIYFLIEKFKGYLYPEMYFLREQFWKTIFFERATYVLKCMTNLWLLISLAAALYFHGYWIVWLLILSKFSPQVKLLQYWHV